MGLLDGKKGRWNWEAVFRYLKAKERAGGNDCRRLAYDSWLSCASGGDV
jgi:hypothetical protein